VTRIAVIGMGSMGSAVGWVLAHSGAEVVTCLEGRSSDTRNRAAAAGIRDVDAASIADVDIILSIVPPSQALTVARQLAEVTVHSKAVFVDCNAVSPETMSSVAREFGARTTSVLDGCIIGGPPQIGKPGPRLYVSGGGSDVVAALIEFGLEARLLDSGIGAASALKMCYAGINKGLIGLGTAMLSAAARSGADKALMAELSESQSEVLAKFAKGIPDMYPKAYRWVAEMEEIAAFLGPDNGGEIFAGMAGVYQQMAEDQADRGAMASVLSALLDQTPAASAARG